MRITEVSVEGYKSFKDVKLEGLNKLIVLIGKNGSGKSNLLEFLEMFFRDCDQLPTKGLGAVNEHHWHNFQTSRAIHARVVFFIHRSPLSGIAPLLFPVDGETATEVKVEVARTLSANGANMEWKTTSFSIDGIPIMERGSLLKPEEIIKKANEKRAATTEGSDQPAVIQSIPADLGNQVLTGVGRGISTGFQIIPAARNRQASVGPANQRNSLLDDATLNAITSVAQLTKASERNSKLIPLEERFERIIPGSEGLSSSQGTLWVKEHRHSMPLPLVGGGVQEVLNLIYRMMTIQGNQPNVSLGIEEPETHLHPEATKLLLSYLRDDEDGGQVWMTTHSPFLLDRAPLTSVILVTKDGTYTSLTKLTDDQEMGHALKEIGVRPSDVFYSDAILLVEGESDREFYRRMALKAGFGFVDRIGIIPTNGVPQERHHLEMWTEIGKRASLPVYVFLDEDAKTEVEEIVGKRLILQRRASILSKGSLEDQYPLDKLEKALQATFNISLKEEKLPERGRWKVISKKLTSEKADNTEWKLRLAKAMVAEMTPEEIPESFRKLMLELGSELGE